MGSRLGRRVVNFANLPIKLLMPTTFTNIHEIALKTICSATKIEIKRVLESMYGFEVEKVRTLNMEGRKKKRGGLLVAKPDYKKAFVTLKTPLSISQDLYPIRIVEEDRKNMNKKVKSSIVEEGEKTKHWLEGDGNHKEHARGYVRGTYHKEQGKAYAHKHREGLKAFNEWRRGGSSGGSGGGGSGVGGGSSGSSGGAKFPWSFLKTGK